MPKYIPNYIKAIAMMLAITVGISTVAEAGSRGRDLLRGIAGIAIGTIIAGAVRHSNRKARARSRCRRAGGRISSRTGRCYIAKRKYKKRHYARRKLRRHARGDRSDQMARGLLRLMLSGNGQSPRRRTRRDSVDRSMEKIICSRPGGGC